MQNTFQPGDLVFWECDRTKPRPTKLTAPNHGPWEVIKQEHNIVQCRHVVNENIEPLHVSRLRLFAGTMEEAVELALRDSDQYMIQAVTAWRGDPKERKKMQFWVEYEDGDAKTLLPSMTLVNEQLCVRFPDILEKHNRTKLLRKYSS